MNRIDRLSAILTLLQSSITVKPKLIIERFGIGIRTVYRDIKSLEESGIPIVGDSRTGYSLVDGFKLPPLMFSQEEAFAFLAAERLVDNFTDAGLKASYKSGVDKIRAVMRLSEKEIIQSIDSNIGKLDFCSSILQDTQNRLQIILNSISKKKQLEISYTSYSKNEITQRTIDPIGVFFSMANWYMIGFCNDRNDYRTFRLSRINSLHQTANIISKKHPPLSQFLKKLEKQPDLKKVIIEVKLKDLYIIDESKYYQGLVRETIKGNLIELHFITYSLERFARWYMSYVDIATISYPKELCLTIQNIIENTFSKIKG